MIHRSAGDGSKVPVVKRHTDEARAKAESPTRVGPLCTQCPRLPPGHEARAKFHRRRGGAVVPPSRKRTSGRPARSRCSARRDVLGRSWRSRGADLAVGQGRQGDSEASEANNVLECVRVTATMRHIGVAGNRSRLCASSGSQKGDLCGRSRKRATSGQQPRSCRAAGPERLSP